MLVADATGSFEGSLELAAALQYKGHRPETSDRSCSGGSRPCSVVREGRLSGGDAGWRNGERAVPAASYLPKHGPPLQFPLRHAMEPLPMPRLRRFLAALLLTPATLLAAPG